MKKLSLFSVSHLALAVSLSSVTAFAPSAAQAESSASGNIGVHSEYLLRGIGRENDDTAVQGGFDYSHDSGFYAGYWGSNLGYSYDKNSATGADPGGQGFENDLYAGFAGAAGDLSYKLGLIQYYYINVDDSDLTEFLANVGYAGFTLQAQYLLNDGAWGNSGDIYWTLGYSLPLPNDFTLAASLGYYTYDDDDNSDLFVTDFDGDGVLTETDSEYRHLNLTLSHPIADTGANMYVQYTNAGEDRTGNQGGDYDDRVIFGVTYGFDL